VGTPALRELQAAFWRSLAGGPGGDADPDLVRVVCAGGALAPGERIGIYAGMYRFRIVDALAEDFPKLAGFLGREAFTDLAQAYLAGHPSTEPSIRHIGRALPAFLVGREPAWLADLARLEWIRLDVFDAPDAVPLTLDALRRVPPEEWAALRFTPVPGFAQLVTEWPVQQLWEESPSPLAPGRTALRVWRDGFLVYQSVMDAGEERALSQLVAGAPFGVVCEAVDDPAEAAALLLRWIEDGIVGAPTDPEPAPPS